MLGDPRLIPETHLREYITTTKDIVRNPCEVGLNNKDPADNASRRDWNNTYQGLHEELVRHKNEGQIPYSNEGSVVSASATADAVALTVGDNATVDAVNATASDNTTIDALNTTSGSDNITTSSSTKRKFEEDSESSIQGPSKQFKQDSSDVLADTDMPNYTDEWGD
jgi:hypothetical protein